MIERFENREADYLRWVHAHPDGYVANVDVQGTRAKYPMVHRAAHKLLWASLDGGYTTGDYIKVCASDFQALEQWCTKAYGRSLSRCGVCMK